MQTFNFPYFVEELKYPQSSTVVEFGGGYQFVSKPNAPDQIRFVLHFETMKFFLNANGTLNKITEPAYNMGRLIDFYEAHRLYEKFTYPSPVKGNVVVRFGSPLTYKPKAGGLGTVEPFSLELILQP